MDPMEMSVEVIKKKEQGQDKSTKRKIVTNLPSREQALRRTVRALSPTKRLAQAPTIMSSSSWQPIGASSNTLIFAHAIGVPANTDLPNLLPKKKTSRPPSARQLHNLKQMDRLVLRPGLARPIRINSARSRAISSHAPQPRES